MDTTKIVASAVAVATAGLVAVAFRTSTPPEPQGQPVERVPLVGSALAAKRVEWAKHPEQELEMDERRAEWSAVPLAERSKRIERCRPTGQHPLAPCLFDGVGR